MHFLHIALFIQFTFFENIVHMTCYNCSIVKRAGSKCSQLLILLGFIVTCKPLGTTHPLLKLANQKVFASVKRDKYVSFQFISEQIERIQYSFLKLYCHFIVTSDNVIVTHFSPIKHYCLLKFPCFYTK